MHLTCAQRHAAAAAHRTWVRQVLVQADWRRARLGHLNAIHRPHGLLLAAAAGRDACAVRHTAVLLAV